MSEGSNKGWIVTFAGTGINLALGVLYSWSIISGSIPASWGWTEFQKGLPYVIACLVFAVMMVPSGKLQDKFGPRMVASLGGILCGVGLIIASRSQDLVVFILGFGILAGSGIGFGYASATPPAVKWFPPAKTGMIAGIVVAGFGLASAYIAPLANYLIKHFSPAVAEGAKPDFTQGIHTTMLILGIAFLVVVVLLAQLLKNPPAPAAAPAKAGAPAPAVAKDWSVMEMLKTPQFFLVWLMFAFNAGAGLMIIGKVKHLVLVQTTTHTKAGFLFVGLLAVGNALGRVLAGTMSDKMGRMKVLLIFTGFQALLMFVTPSMSNFAVLVGICMCIGMCYGSNLALFPSIAKDYYGLKNFGLNYGLIFTAWGVGSIMTLVAGKIYDQTLAAAKAAAATAGTTGDVYGNFNTALYLAGGLLIVTMVLSFITKKPGEPAPAKA